MLHIFLSNRISKRIIIINYYMMHMSQLFKQFPIINEPKQNQYRNNNGYSTLFRISSTCLSLLFLPRASHVPPPFNISSTTPALSATTPTPPTTTAQLSNGHRRSASATDVCPAGNVAFRAQTRVRLWSNRVPRWTGFCLRLRFASLRFVRSASCEKRIKYKKKNEIRLVCWEIE